MTAYEAIIIALTATLVLINVLRFVVEIVKEKEKSNRPAPDQWIG